MHPPSALYQNERLSNNHPGISVKCQGGCVSAVRRALPNYVREGKWQKPALKPSLSLTIALCAASRIMCVRGSGRNRCRIRHFPSQSPYGCLEASLLFSSTAPAARATSPDATMITRGTLTRDPCSPPVDGCPAIIGEAALWSCADSSVVSDSTSSSAALGSVASLGSASPDCRGSAAGSPASPAIEFGIEAGAPPLEIVAPALAVPGMKPFSPFCARLLGGSTPFSKSVFGSVEEPAGGVVCPGVFPGVCPGVGRSLGLVVSDGFVAGGVVASV